MSNQLVVFTLDAQHYALPLERVQRVVRIVEVTPLPEAQEIVLGVIDLVGNIVPVISMRKRFGLPEPEALLTDQLLVADLGTRSVALMVNSVKGVIECISEERTAAQEIVPGMQHVESMTRLPDGILFIHNLDRLLSKKEEQHLDDVLAQSAGTGK
jgi:purine-binding chemotaxis protein CheW